jgi:hypothetical protein
MAKKRDLSDKLVSVRQAQLPLLDKICSTPTAPPLLKAKKLKFWLPEYLRPT